MADVLQAVLFLLSKVLIISCAIALAYGIVMAGVWTKDGTVNNKNNR